GAEDLVPHLVQENGKHQIRRKSFDLQFVEGTKSYDVYYFRPRVEGLFARIEWWVEKEGGVQAKSFWKITTKENISSYYGFRDSTKLTHSDAQHKVFEWCLDMTCDAKGNYIIYDYKADSAEDVLADAKIYEAHRKRRGEDYVYQRYLKRIYYGSNGNFSTVKADGDVLNILKAHSESSEARYFFKAVFDYGEHRSVDWREKNQYQKIDDKIYDELYNWHIRPDAFSHYRAGFEIRTYRRCERVLMFHHIGGENVLVRSTDFGYEQNEYNNTSTLQKVTQRGYRKPKTNDVTCHSEEYYLGQEEYVKSNLYAIKSFPPITFKYSAFQPLSQTFKQVEAEGGDMPPQALSNPNYALVDLFGTGLPDVLETSPYGYYYWKNKGNGQLSRRRQLAEMPSNVRLEMPGVGFGDMAGDGQADLLVHQGNTWGFYETDGTGGWKNFRPYRQYPSFALNDPNVRLTDLTGDGKSDVLRTDERSFVWFPCEGEEGFGKPKYVSRQYDLETFPNVDFADPRVRLADMTGDNLNDIVLVHSGRIDYWANMGNGKFSERITLSNAPRFGANFNPNRLYFADIDGTGTADMIYVDSGKVTIWFNQAGNVWSEGYEINGVVVTDLDGIAITDFYGNGTNGVLITRNYGLGGRNQYSFLDFSGGVKPNLLVEMNNNMGSTTKAQYQPSTYFYRKDYERNYQRAWVSPLPFPVQVLERVEKIDHISRTRLVTEYCYHHGFYDGKEREFRGFAFVEQKDTEFFDQLQEGEVRNFKKEYGVPTVLTKTWFHTGMYESTDLRDMLESLGVSSSDTFDSLDIHALFRAEYWQGDQAAFDLENSVLDASAGNVDSKSISEAFRALRGQVLRQEVYALDDSDKSDKPYTVTESNAKIRLIQPKNDNMHAVYFVYPNESLSYHYERNADDPRMVQELTLKVDATGNVEQSMSIAYPRRNPEHEEQGKLYATLTENKYVQNGKYDTTYTYYAGVGCEIKAYELINLEKVASWESGKKLERSKVIELLERAKESLFHQEADNETELFKRLLSWQQTYFRKIWMEAEIDFGERPSDQSIPAEDLVVRLPLERINPHGLVFESYQAAFPNEQIKLLFPELSNEDLKAAGYHFYS
ncbi:MAG: SpvB/TcaC N-terminal domain-containing protein, partial [Bacteroidota bacterium]